MKWIIVPLFCVATLFAPTMFAQKPQPNHINQDVIGETADRYIENNPDCAFLSNPKPSRAQPRQSERNVFCVPDGDPVAFGKLTPNSSYGGVALKIMEATFLDEDGLVSIAFQLRRSDYNGLAAELSQEFGLPDQTSQFEGDTITWDDGQSRIDLQRGDPDDGFSFLFLNQDNYIWRDALMSASKGQIVDTKAVSIEGDYLVLHGIDGGQIKMRIVSP